VTDAGLRFAEGDDSTVVREALREGILRYALQRSDAPVMPLHRFIGLPASPAALRLVLRNAAIKRAAHQLGARSIGEAARLLTEQLRIVQARWDSSKRKGEPPADLTTAQRELWDALRLGAVPKTPRQLVNILLGE